ncbi:hypothetical protein F5Y15DRAFT_419983 [Xylariaceae sp. FL0016]|nr:hypothetical protein F5Y15DRAFT_419983 [Xylariaceae sp. FL0016]
MSVVPSGEPTGPSGVPTGPSGVPTDSSSMSAIPSGVPTGPSGIPTGPSGQPSSPSSASVGPNGTVPTGTGSAPSGSATSYPGIKTINSLVLLGVIPGDADQNQKRGVAALRRQATDGGFIGGAGPVNPASCDDATLFSLTNGELRSGGQPIATDPGVAYIPIHVNPTASISTTFSVVNGILHWYNTAFAGGEAGFCQVASGQVYATFAAPSTFPAGCAVVSIVVYESTQCQNGQIVPGGPTSVPGNGPGATATPLLPQERDIFPEGDAPDDELCVETTLSWVPGQPTFLPHGPNAEL